MPSPTSPAVRTLLGLCCAALLTPSAGADPVAVTPTFTKGQEWVYEHTTEVSTAQDDQTPHSYSQKTKLRFVVDDVEGQFATVKMQIQGLEIHSQAPDNAFDYTWSLDGEQPEINKDDFPYKDAADGLKILVHELAQSEFTLQVTSKGTITSIQGLSTNILPVRRAARRAVKRALGFMSSTERANATFGIIWNPHELTGEKVEKGHEWTISRTIPTGPTLGDIDIVNSWTIDEASDTAVHMRAAVEVNVGEANMTVAAAPEVETVSTEGDAATLWDPSAGALRNHSERLRVVTRWTLGSLVFEQTDENRTTVHRLN